MMGTQAEQLTLGTALTRELVSAGAHSYELDLKADQFLEVVVDQQGIDVAVGLVAPDQAAIIRVDSPNGRYGPERIVAVAVKPGTYRLEVQAVEPEAPAGRYRIRVVELRPATEKDCERAEAERRFSQAEELRREGKEEPLRQAFDLYDQTLEVWQALGDPARAADVRLRQGWIHEALDEVELARERLEAAVAGYQAAGERLGEAVALNRLGGFRMRHGDNDAALASFEEALPIFRDLGHRAGMAQVFNNYGILYRRLGETGKALEAFDEAQRLHQEAGDSKAEAQILYNLGALLLQQGKLEDAADRVQKSLDLRTALGDLRGAASTLTRLGNIRKRQGRLDEALRSLERALELRREVGHRRGEATTLNDLGTAHLLRGEHGPAEQRYGEALAIYREIGDWRGEAVTLLNLGRLHLSADEPSRALEHFDQTAPLLERLGDRQLEVSNLYGGARALRDLGELEAARSRLASTLERVEQLRTETRSEDFRVAFFATKQHYYDLYIDVLMRLDESDPGAGHAAAAFEVGERRRARALLDGLGEAAADIRQGVDPSLLEEERSIQSELNALERRREEVLPEEALAALDEAARRQRYELDQVRRKIRKTSPRYAELTQPQPLSLEEIRRGLLNRRTVLLSYCLGEERSFLWLVSQDGFESHALPGREEIETAALAAHRLLTERRSSSTARRERQLARLSEILLGPVAGHLRDRRLLIVAEGALLSLPFAALPEPDGERGRGEAGAAPLVERHEIVHLPSASVLATLRREVAGRYPAPKQLAVFADPVFAPSSAPAAEQPGAQPEDLRRSAADFGVTSFSALPHTREEAQASWRSPEARSWRPSDLRRTSRGCSTADSTSISTSISPPMAC